MRQLDLFLLASIFIFCDGYPSEKLKCYVGFHDSLGVYRVGTEVYCDGNCASINTFVEGNNITSFHCASKSTCQYLGLDNSKETLYLDRAVTLMCCDLESNCNTVGYPINVTGLEVTRDKRKVCYSGIFVNNKLVSGPGWSICQGYCVEVSINTIYNGEATVSSVYSCYPSVICEYFNTTNACQKFENFEYCCCNFNNCLDPADHSNQKLALSPNRLMLNNFSNNDKLDKEHSNTLKADDTNTLLAHPSSNRITNK